MRESRAAVGLRVWLSALSIQMLAVVCVQVYAVEAEQGNSSQIIIALNKTWVIQGTEVLCLENRTIQLGGQLITVKDRAEVTMINCRVDGTGGINAYNESTVNLTGVIWGAEREMRVGFNVRDSSSVCIRDCVLAAPGMYLCPTSIETSGRVSIISSRLGGVRRVAGSDLAVVNSVLWGCDQYGLSVGGGTVILIDSEMGSTLLTKEETSHVDVEAGLVYLVSTEVAAMHVVIKCSDALTICRASYIEAKSAGSVGSSLVDLSAPYINITGSSILSWRGGVFSADLTLSGESVRIVDSQLESRAQPPGTKELSIKCLRGYVKNSTLIPTPPGFLPANGSETSFVAEAPLPNLRLSLPSECLSNKPIQINLYWDAGPVLSRPVILADWSQERGWTWSETSVAINAHFDMPYSVQIYHHNGTLAMSLPVVPVRFEPTSRFPTTMVTLAVREAGRYLIVVREPGGESLAAESFDVRGTETDEGDAIGDAVVIALIAVSASLGATILWWASKRKRNRFI